MWRDDVVPIAVEGCGLDVESAELGLGELDAEGIGPLVEFGFDRQASLRGGVRDEVDDDVVGEQRPTAPVLRNVAEHAVLDLVPLARAGWEVGDRDADAGFVGKTLESHLPS